MSGTRTGGIKTTKAVKAKFGKDHYRRIGTMGGQASGPDYQKGGKKASGFAKNPELARIAGAKGGRVSRKTGPNKKSMAQSLDAYEQKYGETSRQPNPAML